VTVALGESYAHGRVLRGLIGSAFQFNQEVDRLNWIHEKYDAISEDMESAFAGGTALGFNTPFLAVRIISDSDFHSPGINPDAAGHGARFVAGVIARLPRALLTRWDPAP
jgi:adenosylhomocysteine nucleosidase